MIRRMSPSRRARIFAAADGICYLCGQVIDGTRERWDADHVIALEISGDDTDANIRPAHIACHRVKTATQDAPQIAKAKRVARKHTGAHRPKATLPGSKGTKWKRRIDGTTVRRKSD